MATYLHALDGRIRVRLPELRGDRRAAATLRRELRRLPGVTAVDANPLTGSLLVEYDDARLSGEDIFAHLDIEAPPHVADSGPVRKTQATGQGKEVRDAVAEKLIEFAAERLLLAVLA